uniref:Transposase Tc1-like domain-containing protein n=1 Tax=Sander lucioperca TaxID=283035 RepID=A0A8D0CN78_SANLU
MTAKDLKASLELANISVHQSTIRKTLNKQGIYGRTPRRKPLLTKKNIAARLKFAKEHIDTPQRQCYVDKCFLRNICNYRHICKLCN